MSFVARGRRPAAALGLAVLLAVVLALSVGVGTGGVGVLDAWHTLLAGSPGPGTVVVRELRVPRGLLALVVGAALGLAGALMQGLTRNPLADPGLLGVNAGAATAVVAGAAVGVTAPTGQVWFGLLGAALAMVVVLALGTAGRGRAGTDRVVLAGAAVTAVLIAAVQGAQLLSPRTFDAVRWWNLGSLAGRGADVLVAVAPVIAVAAVVGLFQARGLDALALGERAGTGLGVRTGRVQLLAAGCATVLCGAATAAVGPIGFLGLAVPHVVRLLTGPDHRWVLGFSVLLAPTVLLAADLVGRVLLPPSEVPVGVVCAVLGAPVFVAVCRRRRLVSL